MNENSDVLQDEYDVVVIGGGAAGLNAGLMLGRSRRSVAVVDAGRPRNAPADAVHGLFAREGTPPGELLARGRAEVRQYGGHVVAGEVADARADGGGGFVVTLDDRRRTVARRVVVATGVVDELPDVRGLADRWGRDVIHCPYCHGWEVRDLAIGVLATGPLAVHQALLMRQLSDDVVILAHHSELAAEDLEKLAARGIEVVDGAVEEVVVADDRITGVRLADGRVVPREVVTVTPYVRVRAPFLEGLGLVAVDHPSGMGQYLPTEVGGRSAVPGVWVAGNVADLSAQVGASAAAGALAGAMVNADLATEDAERAVRVHRAREGTHPSWKSSDSSSSDSS